MEQVTNTAQHWLDQNRVAIACVTERQEIQTLASSFAREMLDEIRILFSKNVRMTINTSESQTYVYCFRTHRARSIAQQKCWPDARLRDAWEETTARHGRFSWLPTSDVSEAGCWTRAGSTNWKWLPESQATREKVEFVWEVFMYMTIARATEAFGGMLGEVAAKATGVKNKPYCNLSTYREDDAQAGTPLGVHVTIGWNKPVA